MRGPASPAHRPHEFNLATASGYEKVTDIESVTASTTSFGVLQVPVYPNEETAI
jgi:hypothetical protein